MFLGKEIMSALDIGPKSCTFKLIPNFTSTTEDEISPSLSSEREFIQYYLGFAKNFRYKALELAKLVEQAKDHEDIDKFTSYSVAKWIFYTNKIENTGAETLGETIEILSNRKSCTNEDEKEVEKTMELLKQSYKQDFQGDYSTVTFDKIKILQWYSTLFPNEQSKIRTDGREAREYNGVVHKYPHHSILNETLCDLLKTVHALAKGISKIYSTWEDRIWYVFALAAFAQFHFVDIHPFADGNGRLCRLISKRLIDWVCPFPFPMFQNRDTYFDTLIEGRNVDPKQSPTLLLSLLLESAIDHYRDLLKSTENGQISFSVSSLEELENAMEEQHLDEETIKKLKEEFNLLVLNETKEVEVNARTFQLTLLISFDDL